MGHACQKAPWSCGFHGLCADQKKSGAMMLMSSGLNDGCCQVGSCRIYAHGLADDESIAGKNNTKLLSKSAFEFPVFNGGARSCLGKKLAETLAAGVITDLVSKFAFREIIDKKLGGCGPGNDRWSKTSLTLPMEGGLPCLVSRRGNPSCQGVTGSRA